MSVMSEATPAVTGAASYRPPRRRSRPTAGFVAVCAVYAAVVAFFAYGLRTPDLDRIWSLRHELKAGRLGAPNGADRVLIERSMERHPTLAHALVHDSDFGIMSSHSDGWLATTEASLIRTDKAAETPLRLEIATPDVLMPLEIELEGRGWRKNHQFRARGVHALSLPPVRGRAEVVVLRMRGKAASAHPSVIGVRVLLDELAAEIATDERRGQGS